MPESWIADMWEHLGTIATVLGFVFNLGCMLVGGTWAISQIKASMADALNKHMQEVDDKFVTMRREVGEMGAALRQKIHEMELYVEQTFVRREGFYKVRDDILEVIKDLRATVEHRLERMEVKIDSKT